MSPIRRPRTPAGKMIVFCGIDGAGKTTLAHELARALERPPRAYRTTFTKLITGEGDFFQHLLQLMKVEPDLAPEVLSWLFAFERFRRANTVLPALFAAHDAVLVDRYFYCDMAYSIARGVDTSLTRRMLELSPAPDIGFVVDVPVELAMRRILSRAKPPWIVQENEPLLRKARQVFLDFAAEWGLCVIDGSGDPALAVERMLDAFRRGEDAGARHRTRAAAGPTVVADEPARVPPPALAAGNQKA